MIIIKIFIGVLVYVGLLVLMCIFFKGATKLGNEYDEKMEVEKVLKELQEGNKNIE